MAPGEGKASWGLRRGPPEPGELGEGALTHPTPLPAHLCGALNTEGTFTGCWRDGHGTPGALAARWLNRACWGPKPFLSVGQPSQGECGEVKTHASHSPSPPGHGATVRRARAGPSFLPPEAELLALRTLDVWGRVNLYEEGCPGHRRVLSGHPHSGMTTQKDSRRCHVAPEGQNRPGGEPPLKSKSACPIVSLSELLTRSREGSGVLGGAVKVPSALSRSGSYRRIPKGTGPFSRQLLTRNSNEKESPVGQDSNN